MLPVIEVKVDWVTLTKRGFWNGIRHAGRAEDVATALQVAKMAMGDMGFSRPILELCSAGKGYHYGFKDYGTGIRISVARNLEKQGCMVVLSGTALARIDDAVLRVSTALESGWRCSRMDVAFDIFDGGIDTDRVATEYLEAHPPGGKRKAAYISDSGGSTLYIGSRYSSKMLRVYDKGKEQRTQLDWLRLEMEYKREYIHASASHILHDPASALHDVLDLLDLPGSLIDGMLRQFASDVPAPDVTIPRPKSNRELWFMTTVLKAYKGLMDDDLGAAGRILEQFAQALNEGADVEPALMHFME